MILLTLLELAAVGIVFLSPPLALYFLLRLYWP